MYIGFWLAFEWVLNGWILVLLWLVIMRQWYIHYRAKMHPFKTQSKANQKTIYTHYKAIQKTLYIQFRAIIHLIYSLIQLCIHYEATTIQLMGLYWQWIGWDELNPYWMFLCSICNLMLRHVQFSRFILRMSLACIHL